MNSMTGWINTILDKLKTNKAVVRVVITNSRGSAPRDAGAAMLVTATASHGSIGGGRLEYDAIHEARLMLGRAGEPWHRQWRDYALGPALGQCCGGQVRLLFEHYTDAERTQLEKLADAGRIFHPRSSGRPLQMMPADAADSDAAKGMTEAHQAGRVAVFIYGAGHVGRALVPMLAAPHLECHWVDFAAERFPLQTDDIAERIIAAEPAIIASHAPPDAIHIVLTHSHALDQAICAAVLEKGCFGRLGLIGSATKAARFRHRLAAAGIEAELLERLVCPVGLAAVAGKHPWQVAVSIAAQIASWTAPA